MTGAKANKPPASSLEVFPSEIQIRIFSFLEPLSISRFRLSSRSCLLLSKDPTAVASLLNNSYGKSASAIKSYIHNHAALTEVVLRIMIRSGAIFPRFLVQKIIRDYFSNRAELSHEFFILAVTMGHGTYGDAVEFKENDIVIFERLVRPSQSSSQVAKECVRRVRQLIHEYHFLPVRELAQKPLSETLFFMTKLSMSLVHDMTKAGFDFKPFHDGIMERVLYYSRLSAEMLRDYLAAGFPLSESVIRRSLASGRASVIEILSAVVEDTVSLRALAMETLKDLFGPYPNPDTPFAIPWSSNSVELLIEHFHFDDEEIGIALLTDPSSQCTLDQPHDEFPVTRCYMKTKPYPAWDWVLERYGGDHTYSIACMDDALSRAIADQQLHELHSKFLAAGFVLRPRHIKILACRVLHKDMTGNALHLMRYLREQVSQRILVSSYQKGESSVLDDEVRTGMVSNSLPCAPSLDAQNQPFIVPTTQDQTGAFPFISDEELVAFRKALKREILNNNEWKERLSTIQLHGGTSGTVHHIQKAPADGIKFLEEARKLCVDIEFASAYSHTNTFQKPLSFSQRFLGSTRSEETLYVSRTMTLRSSITGENPGSVPNFRDLANTSILPTVSGPTLDQLHSQRHRHSQPQLKRRFLHPRRSSLSSSQGRPGLFERVKSLLLKPLVPPRWVKPIVEPSDSNE